MPMEECQWMHHSKEKLVNINRTMTIQFWVWELIIVALWSRCAFSPSLVLLELQRWLNDHSAAVMIPAFVQGITPCSAWGPFHSGLPAYFQKKIPELKKKFLRLKVKKIFAPTAHIFYSLPHTFLIYSIFQTNFLW